MRLVIALVLGVSVSAVLLVAATFSLVIWLGKWAAFGIAYGGFVVFVLGVLAGVLLDSEEDG